jgi:nitrile hydratase alpha subunit
MEWAGVQCRRGIHRDMLRPPRGSFGLHPSRQGARIVAGREGAGRSGSRAVIDPRGVLREFGLELPEDVEIRVWDSTAEVRYLVLPERPAGSEIAAVLPWGEGLRGLRGPHRPACPNTPGKRQAGEIAPGRRSAWRWKKRNEGEAGQFQWVSQSVDPEDYSLGCMTFEGYEEIWKTTILRARSR